MKIYRCKKCGNIIIAINDEGGTLSCCDIKMVELKANSVDAAVEKHVPVISEEDGIVTVTCGEVIHPMTDEHYIEFMIIETDKGYSIKYLNPGDEPKCVFKLVDDEKLISAYAYCNLHGLWVNTK